MDHEAYTTFSTIQGSRIQRGSPFYIYCRIYYNIHGEISVISVMNPLSLPYTLMRRLLVAVLLLLCTGTISARPGEPMQCRPYADMKPWHLGFSVGMHMQDLKFTHNGYITPDGQQWVAEVPDWSPGFCVNVLGDLRLHPYLNLRLSPGMYFGQKTVRMIDYNARHLVPDPASATRITDMQDVKTAYVVVPLDLKFSGMRDVNVRPYATTGLMGAFDISKKRSETLRFNTADLYFTVGLGCDFYLPFFKLNPELKFCFGLTDVLQHKRPDLAENPEAFKMTQSLSKVKSNMVVLSFYFE